MSYPYPAGYPVTVPADQHPARSTATAAIWCAVLGLSCFPLIGSVLGIALGRSAQRRGYPGARATAATILGWLGLALDAAALVWQGASMLGG